MTTSLQVAALPQEARFNKEFGIDTILPDISATDKGSFFKTLSAEIRRLLGVDELSLFTGLCDKGSLANSGVSGGYAIHHIKADNLMKSCAVFVRITEPIDYGKPDDEPVDLVCIVLSSKDDDTMYLPKLSRVSRMLGKHRYRQMLRNAETQEELKDILSGIKHQMLAARSTGADRAAIYTSITPAEAIPLSKVASAATGQPSPRQLKA